MTETPFKIIGHGVYSVDEASRLTRVPSQRIRRWLQGYEFKSRSGLHHSSPVLRHDYEAIEGKFSLSFADLVEVRFVDCFLRAGVSLPAIRLAAERASEVLKLDHPFSTRRFKTDGRTILTELATAGKSPELLDLVRNQMGFKQLIDPFLYRSLDFGPTSQAMRWWPEGGGRKVVIDPGRSFGKPIVAKESVPTRVIFDAFNAEESIGRVAAIFEVSKASVAAAVEFERQLAA
jgi:uncharacterized protein (DUF433 family)